MSTERKLIDYLYYHFGAAWETSAAMQEHAKNILALVEGKPVRGALALPRKASKP